MAGNMRYMVRLSMADIDLCDVCFHHTLWGARFKDCLLPSYAATSASIFRCEVPGSKFVRGHRLRQLLHPSQSFILRVRVSTVLICLEVCFMISGPFDLICKNRCFVIEKCRDWSSCHQLIFVLEFRSIWHPTHDMVQPDSSVGKSTQVQNGRSVVQAPKWLFFRKHNLNWPVHRVSLYVIRKIDWSCLYICFWGTWFES